MQRIGPEDLVLDVGAGARPFARADWVIDLMPYDARGELGARGPGPERFTRDTWVVRDVCDREPWPFDDGQFDFALCTHTLEDVRDPVWVCGELQRVAKAGYIEVPSRLEEQTYGFQGPWVGWGHHRWLVDVDVDGGRIEFVMKHHVVHGPEENHFPARFHDTLSDEQRVQRLWWEGSFEYAERVMLSAGELDPYLRDFVAKNGPTRGLRDRLRARLRAAADRLR